jgi:hypothetical protein
MAAGIRPIRLQNGIRTNDDEETADDELRKADQYPPDAQPAMPSICPPEEEDGDDQENYAVFNQDNSIASEASTLQGRSGRQFC